MTEPKSAWEQFPEKITVTQTKFHGAIVGYPIGKPTQDGDLVATYVLNKVERLKVVYADAE